MCWSCSPTKNCIYLWIFTSHAWHCATYSNWIVNIMSQRKIAFCVLQYFSLFWGNSTLRSTVRILIESIYAGKVPFSLKVGFSAGNVGFRPEKLDFRQEKLDFRPEKPIFFLSEEVHFQCPLFLHVIVFGKLKKMLPSYKLLDY